MCEFAYSVKQRKTIVLENVADLLTDDILLEKILGNYPQPSINIEQWLRNNYGDSLEGAFAAKTVLEGLDREAPLMTKQEQLEVKKDIAYSLKLYNLHDR